MQPSAAKTRSTSTPKLGGPSPYGLESKVDGELVDADGAAPRDVLAADDRVCDSVVVGFQVALVTDPVSRSVVTLRDILGGALHRFRGLFTPAEQAQLVG